MELSYWLTAVRFALFGTAGVSWPPGPHPRFNVTWWAQRFALKQAELRQGRVDVVLLGDSIFQSWERRGPPAWSDYAAAWELLCASRNAINLGFAGDGTPHLLWRVQNWDFSVALPKIAVVLIGANDLMIAGRPATTVVEGIEAIVNTLRLRLPGICILVVSLLPNRVSHWMKRETARVNALLRARDWKADVMLTALDSIFLRDGKIDPKQYVDPLLNPPLPILLHPTPAAARRMAESIELTLIGMC